VGTSYDDLLQTVWRQRPISGVLREYICANPKRATRARDPRSKIIDGSTGSDASFFVSENSTAKSIAD